MKGEYRVGTKKAQAICSFLEIEWNPKWLGLRVSPIKRRRSNDQNALYWVVVSALAEFSGFTKEEMHEELLCEKHGYDLVRFRGMERKRPRGRSSNLTAEDFGELMIIAERWAAEMGVSWEKAA